MASFDEQQQQQQQEQQQFPQQQQQQQQFGDGAVVDVFDCVYEIIEIDEWITVNDEMMEVEVVKEIRSGEEENEVREAVEAIIVNRTEEEEELPHEVDSDATEIDEAYADDEDDQQAEGKSGKLVLPFFLSFSLLTNTDFIPAESSQTSKQEKVKKRRRIRPKPSAAKRASNPCPHCDQSFPYPSLLERHKLVHTGVREHLCPICSKSFNRKSTLTEHHKRVHEVEKPKRDKETVCLPCGLRFRYPANLRQHKLAMHNEGAGAFQCATCSKTFKRPDYLKQHQLVHTGVRAYHCSYCSRSFKQPGQLYTHTRTHITRNG